MAGAAVERKEQGRTRKARAEAATAGNAALTAILATAGRIDDDDTAREFITSFGLTEHCRTPRSPGLSKPASPSWRAASRRRDIRQAAETNPAFAALFGPLKKKLHDPVSFAGDADPVSSLTDRLEDATAAHFTRRLDAIRAALDAADSYEAAAQALLALAARWTPDALASRIGDALELAALLGREAVFAEAEEANSFADPDVFNQPFHEQIAYFEQKRVKPTREWTDAMRGVHDRSFVIAGATDPAMLSEFQTALADAMQKGTTLETFRKDFDRIAARYGWSYKGERGWRTRVIFETNMRTSYMAGRLKQMRDPDVLKLRPIWQYRHGETRLPKSPREKHKAWHGLCLRHDDPFWDTHFPPNGWLCSCGVRTLSMRELKMLGKEAPTRRRPQLMEPIVDPLTGQADRASAGHRLWLGLPAGPPLEQGLVPSSLMGEARHCSTPAHGGGDRHAGAAWTPARSAVAVHVRAARRKAWRPRTMSPFLKPFDADIGKAVLFEDKAGAKMPVSDLLFRDRAGELKVTEGDRPR